MPNPNLRTLILSWSNLGMAGDELLELWLKTGSSWALDSTIAVTSNPTQTHTFSLAPGTTYSFQIRARRGGVYRAGYTSGNPEDWPSGSRLDYTTGLPKPTLTFTGWARTSSTARHLSFTLGNLVSARGTRFYKSTNGGSSFSLVATIGAGTSTYDYAIQGGEDGVDMVFYVDQLADDSTSNPSDHLTAYAGLEAPDTLAQSGTTPDFYAYHATWNNNHAGVQTRIADHYDGVYTNRVLTAANATTGDVTGLPKSSAHGSNGNVPGPAYVRIRSELTSFTVTDVSKWVPNDTGLLFQIDIANDETLYFGP